MGFAGLSSSSCLYIQGSPCLSQEPEKGGPMLSQKTVHPELVAFVVTIGFSSSFIFMYILLPAWLAKEECGQRQEWLLFIICSSWRRDSYLDLIICWLPMSTIVPSLLYDSSFCQRQLCLLSCLIRTVFRSFTCLFGPCPSAS